MRTKPESSRKQKITPKVASIRDEKTNNSKDVYNQQWYKEKIKLLENDHNTLYELKLKADFMKLQTEEGKDYLKDIQIKIKKSMKYIYDDRLDLESELFLRELADLNKKNKGNAK